MTRSPDLTTVNGLLLAGAWLAAWLAFSPVINAPWFYDDADYVLNDPRLNHLELFSPAHWSTPPPPLDDSRHEAILLPGYDKPPIADRYLWHLSFALERRALGSADTENPAYAHALNLLLHLACIGALFFALSRLLEVYQFPPLKKEDIEREKDNKKLTPPYPPFSRGGEKPNEYWRLLPGLAALLFAVQPWAAEPVCYVSARNASMGAFFVLLGVGLWAMALCPASGRWRRTLLVAGALFCALAAFSCKENFITACAAYALVSWPLVWRKSWRKAAFHVLLLALGVAAGLAVVAWLGIQASARAGGLAAQVVDHGWGYFFNIQNPLLLLTLSDQLPALRLSLEANHPGWPAWACGLALCLNVGLFGWGIWGGRRWPVLLGLAWFYLHLIPTNSFLPRPDFLAARNVYLPTAGIALLVAGGLVWLFARQNRGAGWKPALPVCLGLALCAYWGAKSRAWAESFVEPERVWAKSAEVAPDHATVRLNLAAAIYYRAADAQDFAAAQRELQAALKAEDSPTMQYHSERPHAQRRALALRMLGLIHYHDQDMRGAEQLLRQSWSQLPSLVTWLNWAAACLDGKLNPELEQVVVEGLRCWPQAWWPQALQGLGNTGNNRDLEAAERAPDAALPELRWLQRLALYKLALAEPIRAREAQWAERLHRLGLSDQDMAHLSQVLMPRETGP